MNKENFFQDIADHLESFRKSFNNSKLDDGDSLRSIEEAKLILGFYQSTHPLLFSLFEEHPSLESLFEKDFGAFNFYDDREALLDICFLEDYLFPDKGSLVLSFEANITHELVDNYMLSVKDWIGEATQDHLKTQKLIHEELTSEVKEKEMACQCQKCIADFRAKLRDQVFTELKEEINKSHAELFDILVEQRISFISDYYSKLKKRLDRKVHSVRYQLKKGSLNRLENDVKEILKHKFGVHTELGKVYQERLKSYFNSILVDEDIATDMITEEEYQRFFSQIGLGIWKAPNHLKREFQKVLNSIMALKRKDISATILRDYLGQFWTHSTARAKKRHVIYHMGPTNSGKTWNSIEALSKAKTGCYLAPLRLLASELFDTLNDKGAKTTLLTGEEVVEIEGATHYSSTIEMAKMNESFECAVIDEIQMISDPHRGWAWTRALVNLNADEIHLAGDHSVLDLVKQILELTGDTLEIKTYERKTKLHVMKKKIKLSQLEKHDALIVFSRRNALKYKADLEKLGFKVSIVYGRLSPEVRREQARKFDSGETDIMVSTDAIAMGMNLPIQRVVFSTLSKFISSKEIPITNSEIKQIAGRAGRFGRFPDGYVTTIEAVDEGLERVEEALNCDLKQSEYAMVGPDLDIFGSVNQALEDATLKTLGLSEFLRLFNTMIFEKPFYCVDLNEMVEVTEMIEEVDTNKVLSDGEVFGFACAPVNLGLAEHVQYYIWIASNYVKSAPITNEEIETDSDDIDYLERAIKCVELYQWLARHFDNKNFEFSAEALLENKADAIEKLNLLLSEKIAKSCSSCGVKLPDEFNFNICEGCFGSRRSGYRNNRGKKKVSTTRAQSSRKKSSASSTFSKKKSSSRTSKRRRK